MLFTESQFAKEFGLKRTTVQTRRNKGYSAEEILNGRNRRKYFVCGKFYNQKELAEYLGISPQLLNIRLVKNRKSLREVLDEFGKFKLLSKEQQASVYRELKEKEVAHYEKMKYRAQEDVRINKALWEDFKNRLVEMYTQVKENIDAGNVGGTRVSEDEELYIDGLVGLSVDEHIDNILSFLMFKADCAVLQEKTMWEVDVPYLRS